MEFGNNPISWNVPDGLEMMKPKVSDWHNHTYPEHHGGYQTGRTEKFSNGTMFTQDFDMNKPVQYRSQLSMPNPPPMMPLGGLIPPSQMGPL